jgi:histidine triad (HIT) family protein
MVYNIDLRFFMTIDCLFCKIADGKIPSNLLYEDEICLAFADISPQAPFHVLVIPRKHLDSLNSTSDEDGETLGHLLLTCANIARQNGFAENGYRTVINTNNDGGQTVFHLHIHLLAGRQFVFPPG